MRICLFGQGPLCEAVHAALEAQGHDLLGPYASPQPTEVLRSTQASVGLSCGYRHKLLPQEWECFPDGILNLHTGYLPWNKGAYPNVWPILDGSPAGVTLHRVDEGIDTGPIISQVRVAVWPWDTARTLYGKLKRRGVQLVQRTVAEAERGWPPGTPQNAAEGSRHLKRDLAEENWGNFEEWHPEAQNLLLSLRAASFPDMGYGLRYRHEGRELKAVITITEVGDVKPSDWRRANADTR